MQKISRTIKCIMGTRGVSIGCRRKTNKSRENRFPIYSRWFPENGTSFVNNKAKKLLICETLSFALTIWYERYLGKYYQEIYKIYENARHLNNSEKIYILTKPNVPFVQDGYRDGEHIREWMFERFIQELDKYNMKYYIIDSPNYDERYNKALEIIFENLW